jgi:hypothetical protein
MKIPDEITHSGPLVLQVMRIHARLNALAEEMSELKGDELEEELAWTLGGGIDPWAFSRPEEYALAAQVLEEVADTLEATFIHHFEEPSPPCEGRRRRRRVIPWIR